MKSNGDEELEWRRQQGFYRMKEVLDRQGYHFPATTKETDVCRRNRPEEEKETQEAAIDPPTCLRPGFLNTVIVKGRTHEHTPSSTSRPPFANRPAPTGPA